MSRKTTVEQPSRESRVHFEEETGTAAQAAPQVKRGKGCEIWVQDWAEEQAEMEARVVARNQEWRAQQQRENTERRLRVEEVRRRARIPRDHTPVPGDEDYDTDEEFWREQDASDLLKHRNFPVHVYWKAFCDRSVIFNNSRGETVRSLVEEPHHEFDIVLDEKFSEKAQTSGHTFEIVSRSITVRSHKLRVPKVQQTIDDISSENWIKVDEILGAMWHNTYEHMDLIIEVKTIKKPGSQSASQKRQRETVSDRDPDDITSSPDPKQRRTRTTHLLGQQDSKLEERARQGRYEKETVDRWQCQSSRCRNFQSFCFVDLNNQHYNIQTGHMERWANAIRIGDATKENPPLALYQLWVSQGAVDVQYKAPLAKQEREEKKDSMAQGMATLMEMNERAFQMKMAQSLTTAPCVPNFFIEAKGPAGGYTVCERQALYDGALGARGIGKLRAYIDAETAYDGNAYNASSTSLKFHAHHCTRSPNPNHGFEYYMTQIHTYFMDNSVDEFRQGASALRNARDWAREKRDELVLAANSKVEHSNWASSTPTFNSLSSDRTAHWETGTSSTDELAVDTNTIANPAAGLWLEKSANANVQISTITKTMSGKNMVMTTMENSSADDPPEHRNKWEHLSNAKHITKDGTWYQVIANYINIARFNGNMDLLKSEVETYNQGLKLRFAPRWLSKDWIEHATPRLHSPLQLQQKHNLQRPKHWRNKSRNFSIQPCSTKHTMCKLPKI
ncbi:hypothetical protein MMC07_008244 [Pseudocyphellaria aurata]|nr:hypothetical protein [Pseudocyphellaria aurata]